MAFLNPLWLLALPLIALPILIHLLNQRRHRSIQWGAMQFLLTAKRMNRGIARLKQILIMAARMAAIAGLIFAVSRPLSSGWVGSITGGQPETIIVLLDRSASMQQQQPTTGESKLKSGLAKIVAALQTMGYQKPLVLIESGQELPLTLERPADLLDHPQTGPTETTADIPAMLQAALDHIVQNQTGRTDIWLLSDARANDWSADSSRWRALQSSYAKLEGVRFQVLQYPDLPVENLSLTIDQVRRQTAPDNPAAAELLIDLTVARRNPPSGPGAEKVVPLTFDIHGLRSVVELELSGSTTSLIGHRIPIDQEMVSGWGSVQLPFDENES
ncbi:MAG: BatA domain-containing protein, partial [Planctomycetaceae bacterium]|nr:BatA domain-containing protein [Planctomycetaceae bacterium]